MKLNKLVIAMGLASLALTACNSDSGTAPVTPAEKADFTITAIDGYILNGLVTATCGDKVYKDRTDDKGVAELLAEGNAVTDCTAVITGDKDTRDADFPKVAWEHTMSTLPGLSVINPYTDVAAIVLANNPGMSVKNVMQQVVKVLNIPVDLIADGVDLFADFGENNASTGLDTVSLAKIAVLAQSTFAQTVEIKKALPANATAAQVEATYKVVLPQVTTAVKAEIARVGEYKLSNKVIVVTVTLPEKIEFKNDGTIATDLGKLPVKVVTTTKPGKDEDKATGTGTGTGTGTDGVNQN